MRDMFFPRRFFPTALSIVYFHVFVIALSVGLSILFITPTMSQELGQEFTQPKPLNSLLAAGVFASMFGYVIERLIHRND